MIEVKTNTKYHLVFSHDDADGILAAFTIKYAYDDNLVNSSFPRNVHCHLCGYNKFNLSRFKALVDAYLNELKKDAVEPSEVIVYMLDYAIQPNEDMMKFYNFVTKIRGAEFYWIDHHETALENLIHFNIPGLQRSSTCGAKLALEFVKVNQPDAFTQMNEKIYDLVDAFDTWKHDTNYSWDKEILPGTLALAGFKPTLNDNKSEIVNFLKNSLDPKWSQSLDNYITSIGQAIKNYRDNSIDKESGMIYEAVWRETQYKCLVLNAIDKGSMVFDSVPHDNVDLFVIWNFDGEKYIYSVYTERDDIDVGQLCEKYLNGGGHQKSAGGHSKDFIF